MSDAEQVQQALAELWDVVKCRCNEAYTGRGLHDPDCECDSADAVKVVADRINALTEQLTATQHDAKEAEAYAEELEADRKKTYEALLKVSRIHGEVEAKLATCEKYRDAYAECDRIGTQAVRDLEAKLKTSEEIGRAFEEDAGQLREKLAKAVEIGNKMARSIEKNYYLPNIAGEWHKVTAEISSEAALNKGESHD